MHFDFSDEQEQLRDQLRRLLREQCSGTAVRAVLESDRTHDPALWDALADVGCLGIAMAEAHGGAGASCLELCVIAEELGRALAPVPFASSIYLAAEALRLAGSEEQQARWLPRLASGEVIGTLALAEGPGMASWHKPATRVRGGAIDGIKLPVTDGLAADIAIVVAGDADGEPGLYLVELEQPGVRREHEPGFDESRPLARLRFEQAAAERLDRGDGAALEHLISRAAVLFAFEQLGVAAASLDMAVAYAQQRRAFGRTIGSFQAIKHRLADMYAELEMARSNGYYAAWALASDSAELPAAAACARLSASRAAFFCTKENIQVHGGIGFTWELDAHLYYRRAKVLSLVIGGERRWQERLIAALEHREAA